MTHDQAIQEAKDWLAHISKLTPAPGWEESYYRRYETLKYLINIAEEHNKWGLSNETGNHV